MLNFHDVLRYLVRTSRFADEAVQREALLAVDAHEAGFPSTDDYQKDLDAKAAAAAQEAGGPETPEQKAARLEAENVRLQAQLRAQAGREAAAAGTPPA